MRRRSKTVAHLEKDLQVLITKGRSQGYLTYDEVNTYLPDEDVHPEKVDNLLAALDSAGIELCDAPPEGRPRHSLPRSRLCRQLPRKLL